MKISVIVPIYNVENYLEKCLDRIINQTFKDIEIILVNDGSTDMSEIICKKYKERDGRVKYFYKKNGGLSSARNFGIDASKGDYLFFVDSDDYIELNVCEVLYKKAVDVGADLVISGYRTVNASNGDTHDNIPNMKNKVFDLSNINKKKEFMHELMDESILIEVIWNKLYKRSLFDGMRFPYRKFEDTFMCYELYDTVKKVAIVEDITYNYLVGRTGSITSVSEVWNLESADSAFFRAYNFYINYNEDKIMHELFYRCMKNIIKKIDAEKSGNEDISILRKLLVRLLKDMSASKIGLMNKIKTLFRYK